MIEGALFWAGVFFIALLALLKGADWLVKSGERIGLHFGLSPFVVGVVIIGIGTSSPELVSSLVASITGFTEIVTATAVGSNISNILLVIGLAAIVSSNIVVKKNLIYLDLPLLVTSTIIFLFLAWDKTITFVDSLFLLIAYAVYLFYTLTFSDKTVLHERLTVHEKPSPRPRIHWSDFVVLIAGAALLAVGAKYVVDATVNLSLLLNIGVGVISMFAIALGTSLPELVVTFRAAIFHKSELAIGNIFGSNFFNILVLVGLPGLFGRLTVSEPTFTLGFPILIAATVAFVITGISNKFHRWDGALYLIIYLIFIGKLFGVI